MRLKYSIENIQSKASHHENVHRESKMELLLPKPKFIGRIDFEIKYPNIIFFSKIMVEGALPGFWEHKRKSKHRLRFRPSLIACYLHD